MVPFDHVLIDDLGHYGDGHCSRRGAQNVLDLFENNSVTVNCTIFFMNINAYI